MSEISFADLDTASVEATVLTGYERIAETTLYPGDPVRLFLESLAYVLAIHNHVIDLAGRQNLLAYAQGNHLDFIGMMVDTPRLGNGYAICTQRLELEGVDFGVEIPVGTKVTTADGNRVFSVAAAVAAAGATHIDLTATAEQPGADGNGLVPGQINRLIKPLPYVKSTTNITASALGADVESDEHYRARIQEAPEAFTCAGPAGAYRSLAKAVHQDIAEVAVWSPKPGSVDVRPVMQGGAQRGSGGQHHGCGGRGGGKIPALAARQAGTRHSAHQADQPHGTGGGPARGRAVAGVHRSGRPPVGQGNLHHRQVRGARG